MECTSTTLQLSVIIAAEVRITCSAYDIIYSCNSIKAALHYRQSSAGRPAGPHCPAERYMDGSAGVVVANDERCLATTLSIEYCNSTLQCAWLITSNALNISPICNSRRSYTKPADCRRDTMRVRRFYEPEAYKIDSKSLSNCQRLLQQVFSLPELYSKYRLHNLCRQIFPADIGVSVAVGEGSPPVR